MCASKTRKSKRLKRTQDFQNGQSNAETKAESVQNDGSPEAEKAISLD